MYMVIRYSLCSGSHFLLHLKPYKDQLFSIFIYRISEADVLLYCLSDTENVSCTARRHVI